MPYTAYDVANFMLKSLFHECIKIKKIPDVLSLSLSLSRSLTQSSLW